MPRTWCLDCGRSSTGARCRACKRRLYRRRNAERSSAREIVAAWVQVHGPLCPGFGRSPHEVRVQELTADHAARPFRDGGRLDDGAQVLCRACNARKGS